MIRLRRWGNPDCTGGRLFFENFQCFTLEKPWLDNQENISCIPVGEYCYYSSTSTRNGKVLQLENVEDRTSIQIHAGNYINQTQGCILVGDSIRLLNNDKIPDVANSRNTLTNLLELAGKSGVIQIR